MGTTRSSIERLHVVGWVNDIQRADAALNPRPNREIEHDRDGYVDWDPRQPSRLESPLPDHV